VSGVCFYARAREGATDELSSCAFLPKVRRMP
ncbi:hypothetical protein A2U01_0087253, partial [Trifolium medium]|nr:hypothetical protein [Trifolium medium]